MEIGNEKFRKERRRDFDDLSKTFEGNFRFFLGAMPHSTPASFTI